MNITYTGMSNFRRQQMAGPDRRTASQRRPSEEILQRGQQAPDNVIVTPGRGRPGGSGRQDWAETMFNPHLDRGVKRR
jgi:hypothetical protein